MEDQVQAIFFPKPLDSTYLAYTLAEIYKDKTYVPLLEGRHDLTILDIGGNLGITSYYFSQFAKQVYTLEPAMEHYNIMTQMLAFNKITNVKAIKKALYTKNGPQTFHKNSINKSMWSLFGNVDDKVLPTEEVDCITIDTLFEQEGITHVDFMKLDVEGSEVEIICSPGFKKVAPMIDCMVIELHAWSGRHPNNILEALKVNGFELEMMPRPTPNDAQILIARRK